MNILLCAHGGALCRQLVRRFQKEGHTVSLNTGSEKQEDLGASGAFQVYPFSYANENLSRVMRSAAADVLIIQGVHDPLYDWRGGAKTTARFLADAANLLCCAKSAGVGRVLFLSALGAQDAPAGQDGGQELRRAAVCAEGLVHAYADSAMRTAVLRLPPVVCGGEGGGMPSVCRRMAEQYLWEHELHYAPKARHREIFYPDAAEAVYRAAQEPNPAPLMQVGGFLFAEHSFAKALRDSGTVDDSLLTVCREPDAAPGQEAPLAHEMKLWIKYTPQNAAGMLLGELQAARRREERLARRGSGPWRERILPLLENMAVFALALLLTWLLRDTWAGERLHLLYAYVLVIGVTWGMAHALLASLLSGLAMFAMMQSPGVPLSMDYGYFLRFLELVGLGVTGGYMRDKYRRKAQDLQDENAFLTREVRDLTRINDGNVYVRRLFERRLTNYHNSLARIYQIVSQLDSMESRRVLFHAVRVVAQLLETPHAAVYVASGQGGFFRLAAAGTQRARRLGKSIRYDAQSFLYGALSQREIYQNRTMEAGKPTFAGAVYRSGVPAVIVMVWMDEIERVNLYTSNLLAVLCRLLESSVHRAVLYEEALAQSAYVPGTRIMVEEAFRRMLDTFEEGRRQGLLEYVLLRVKGEGERAQRLVRDTDVLGRLGGGLYVLLSNSAREDAQIVAGRFRANGMELEEVEAP